MSETVDRIDVERERRELPEAAPPIQVEAAAPIADEAPASTEGAVAPPAEAPRELSTDEPSASPEGLPPTRLDPLETDDLPTVAEWLGREANYRWLHFGPGRQSLDEVTLRFMVQRDLHLLRTFRPEDHDHPVGVAALSDVDREFGTAAVWYVLGDERFGGRGYTTCAVAGLLDEAFRELGLESVYAWTVETNRPSRRLLRRLGFRLAGRRRRCHRMDGVVYDRLLYDLLPDELAVEGGKEAA